MVYRMIVVSFILLTVCFDEFATAQSSPTETVVCSSFDEAGLFAAFDTALAAFLANARATYGDQYDNLQYQLSSKTATLADNQGTVSATYAGSVTELATGEAVGAYGSLGANFTWDGCAWQMVDYWFT